MQARAILETVLYAGDLAAAEAFYADVFGLEVVSRLEGKFVFLRCGEGMLLIFDPAQSAAPDPANPIPRHGAAGAGHLCFAAADAAEMTRWADLFADRGITVEADHRWPNGARSLYLRDPAGNSVEVAERRLWQG
ncbi:VOC family protein [Acidimangrovimonas sediminis]|uniref:VOC family protein n=1 Tax=Acidimangrovimonas sediminis TaxID=2056283 RepID=UPI000C807445|nr:VOC family protein [Acidimangrovimonas sediminis]